MAYLTYIIENYHFLPNVSIFLHSHRDGYPGGWHTDTPNHSNVYSAQNLRQDNVWKDGFVNLRCNPLPGCDPHEVLPFRNPPDKTKTTELAYAGAWRQLMGPEVPVPMEVATACCGQFAVARWQVLKRRKGEYERYRQWLFDTELDDGVSGRVFEYLWHVIFGRDPVFCPGYRECMRNVYRVER